MTIRMQTLENESDWKRKMQIIDSTRIGSREILMFSLTPKCIHGIHPAALFAGYTPAISPTMRDTANPTTISSIGNTFGSFIKLCAP